MSEATAAAWEPWRPGGFGAVAASPRGAGERASEPAVKLPTAGEVEQIHQEAHRSGYAAGYEEGTARARREAMQLHTVLEHAERAFAALDQAVAEEVLALSIAIARRMVSEAYSVRPELVLDVVREALAQLPHHHAAVHLNPEDAALVRSHLGEQLTHTGHRLFEDPAMARGGVRVEAGGSTLDGSIETRWRRVLEPLGSPEPWLATGQAA